MAMGGTGFLGALYLPRFINSNGQTPAVPGVYLILCPVWKQFRLLY